MPESISSCGVLNAPPARITSRPARTTRGSPALPEASGCARYRRSPFRYSTPVARLSASNSTRVASAFSSILSRSGWRAATSSRRSRVPTRWCRSVLSGVKQSPSALRRSTRRSFGSSRDSTSRRRASHRARRSVQRRERGLGERRHQPPVVEHLPRHRAFGRQPAVPAMSRPVQAESRQACATPAGSGIAPVAGSSAACPSRATMHRRSVPRCRPNRNRAAPSGSSHCARCSRRACRRADSRCPRGCSLRSRRCRAASS